MPPKKSLFRQPDAKHFQLVHRSQRDPLIHDPEASQHVLKPFVRENAKKGKSRADLEELLPLAELAAGGRQNIGEAALYGIYYDDSEYDYMQHLRQVGVQEDGVESILMEAPTTSKGKGKKKEKELNILPEGVLASTSELPRTYESQQAVPESISGFQPDMDPHLRQVLEALEDDAFVDDDVEDDFFGELVADGERRSDEEVEFDFDEDGIDGEVEGAQVEEGESRLEEEASWEERFAAFKKTQKHAEQDAESDDEFISEAGDTVSGLPAMSVIGGKKRRRKGTSDASGYSMSSSSMFRNEALQTLDERFDQMILKEYNEDGGNEPEMSDSDSDSEEAPELITSREDFDTMINEFLNDYEILGRKMKPKLEGGSGAEKLDTLRRAMGQDERVRVTEGDEDEENDDDLFAEEEDKKDRWDCETILSTYSNLDNHPRMIRARDMKPTPKIYLDPKTGLPSILSDSPKENAKTKSGRGRVKFEANSEDSDEDTEIESRVKRQTITRSRNETKEEKKERKAAVKVERHSRRADKKAMKEQFDAELKTQKKTIGNKERKMRKL